MDTTDDQMTPGEMQELLGILTRTFQRTISDMIEMRSQVDALEIMIVSLANHIGLNPEEVAAKLRTAQETAHQKRLENVEARNPAAAAMADNREGLPEFDEEMLRKMSIGEQPPGGPRP